MFLDVKDCIELGGEDQPNSDMSTQSLLRECVLHITIEGDQPPPDYLFKPDIIIAILASVTAYVPKDVVLLNDREAMVEFEGEVPIEILNENVSVIRKWMGISDVSVQCCQPI